MIRNVTEMQNSTRFIRVLAPGAMHFGTWQSCLYLKSAPEAHQDKQGSQVHDILLNSQILLLFKFPVLLTQGGGR